MWQKVVKCHHRQFLATNFKSIKFNSLRNLHQKMNSINHLTFASSSTFSSPRDYPYALPAPITAAEFRERRHKFIDHLRQIAVEKTKKEEPPILALLPAQRLHFSGPDVPYPYRQCSSFRYLCGVDQPNCWLLLLPKETVLFVAEQTAHQALWEGAQSSTNELIQISGVDQVLPLSEFEPFFASHLRTDALVCVDAERLRLEGHFDSAAKQLYAVIDNLPGKNVLSSLSVELDKLRWIKSRAEQEHMRATCRIGSEILNAAMVTCHAFDNESHLVGLLEFEARRRGAARLAYPPVVAAGRNACTLHYITADKPVGPSDCLLIDSGSELGSGYCSDITRCFPHAGQFSSAQKTLYDVLEHVQTQLLRYVRDTRPLRLSDLYFYMLERMGDALMSSVFFKRDRLSREQLTQECDKLCPHHVSHYLGLDVHDTASVSRSIELPPGVVITVEPGIYIRPDNALVRDEFRGIGMRIEDDVLITDTGAEVLTEKCLRSSADIEFAITNR